ncbi:MAG: YbaB/EbfC family nucleoid-associated protein [Candidatus Doudnabacteria bacterium]|nr:YbaB/EbfC family nucleoid-associated protein [Candidatus Doudnabacteria bacterium]
MGLFDKLKDINEMRKQASQMQAMLAQQTVTGESGGGKVKITIDGNMDVKSVEVAPEVAGDKSEVARHVRSALEDTFKQHKKMLQKNFSGMLQ